MENRDRLCNQLDLRFKNKPGTVVDNNKTQQNT